ncbi:MAG: hypothetical protein LLG01_00705 [Planctomycetaceae bacterium]|nr:hypothetical protein [Planctomycetaceae bacterium]
MTTKPTKTPPAVRRMIGLDAKTYALLQQGQIKAASSRGKLVSLSQFAREVIRRGLEAMNL